MHLSFKPINDNMKKGPVLQTLTTMGIATRTVMIVRQTWEQKSKGNIPKSGTYINS